MRDRKSGFFQRLAHRVKFVRRCEYLERIAVAQILVDPLHAIEKRLWIVFFDGFDGEEFVDVDRGVEIDAQRIQRGCECVFGNQCGRLSDMIDDIP